MKIETPPLYPAVKIIPSFTRDALHNRRELDACNALAAEMGGDVELPPGAWPIEPLSP